MLKNYFKVLFRSLTRNGIYSFINIFGLSIGITCSFLILLWVFDETSFDRFHPKADRLYQVWIHATYDGKIHSYTSVPLPTYEAVRSEHNAIVNSAVADWGGDRMLSVGEKRLVKASHAVSEEFLTMFEFPMLQGVPDKALSEPTGIVLSQSTANALFGDEDPMNKEVILDNKDVLKVTGVLKDVPKNSSFQFDFLIPWKHYETQDWVKRDKSNWGNYSYQVFVELNSQQSGGAAEASIRDLLKRKGEVDVKREFFLHPLTAWRLHSRFENGKESGGMIDYVRMFTVIAIFILVIACINFMNLATARSEGRAREVGIRKSVGSARFQIILQFMGESVFIALVSFGLAILLSELLLPFYNQLVQKQLFIDYQSPSFWIYALSLIVFTGVVAGSYPALYLSSFQPARVLKGKTAAGKGASAPRKVLVTLQFGFSILLIVGTLVVYQQIQYVKNRDIGYSQKNLITVQYTRDLAKHFLALKEELLQSGYVTSMTRSNSPITEIWSNNFMDWPGKPEDQKVSFATIACDFDWTKTMGIKVLEGRDFSLDFKSDSSAIIINKAALDLTGLKDPLGTELEVWGKKRKLIGVIDNVLMGSPDRPVGPAFMLLDSTWVSSVTIRIQETNDLKATLDGIEAIFKKYNPAYPFDYTFVDQQFQKKFTTISMTGKLANIFASLAIVITGLGLFGLAAFTAEQRTREMGIRKVMGASVPGLVSLISVDFSKLVLLAFLISAPLSWWLLDNYLQRYAYRIEIAWWIFPVTGLVALLFAVLIVSTQAIRAARANPAHSLRAE